MAQGDLRLYKRLLGYAKPYWPIALMSVLAMVASAALEPLFPALMEPLIDKSLIARDSQSLWQVPLLIVLVFVAKGIADYVGTVASKALAQKTVADLRALVFAHQLDLPMAHHRKEDAGRMLTRITFDTANVGEAVSSAWLVVVRDSLVLVGLVGFLFYTAWQLALLVLIMAPVLALVIRKTNRLLRRSSESIQGRMGGLSALVQEALLGLQEIKIFGAFQGQQSRFDRANKELRHDQMRAIRVSALNVPLVQVLAACCVALVIYVASSLSADNQLSPGEFVAFITAMSMVFEPVRRLTNVNAVLQRGLAAAESIFGILDSRPEGGSRSRGKTQGTGTGSANGTGTGAGSGAGAGAGSGAGSGAGAGAGAGTGSGTLSLAGDIEFVDVSYSHAHQEARALNHFNLHVAEGESVVLVGPSGAGKSTILYLLCGFDSPTEGQIRIGGRSIEEIDLALLRAQISLVAQRTQLFDLTIRENIALGRLWGGETPVVDAEVREAQIIEAAKRANAWDFISALPQGLDTSLGSLGDRLSGGQRQRIAIARAFLKDAPILLLDEATSALDQDSEQAVLKGLEELMAGRTVIMVSHAPERLLHVDRTIELKATQ